MLRARDRITCGDSADGFIPFLYCVSRNKTVHFLLKEIIVSTTIRCVWKVTINATINLIILFIFCSWHMSICSANWLHSNSIGWCPHGWRQLGVINLFQNRKEIRRLSRFLTITGKIQKIPVLAQKESTAFQYHYGLNIGKFQILRIIKSFNLRISQNYISASYSSKNWSDYYSWA